MASLVDWLFSDGCEWVDAAPHLRFVARFGKLFEPCRAGMHGFIVYELLNTVATGILRGIMPASDSACQLILVIMCVQAALYLGSLLRCRPYATQADNALIIFAGVCNLVVAITALLDDSYISVLTTSVLAYVSLFGVLCFVVQVVILTRLHRHLPSLLQTVIVLMMSNKAWRVPAASRESRENHLPEASAIAHHRFPCDNERTAQCVNLARPGVFPLSAVDVESELCRQMQLQRVLRCLIPAVDPHTSPQQRLALLVEAACNQRGLAL